MLCCLTGQNSIGLLLFGKVYGSLQVGPESGIGNPQLLTVFCDGAAGNGQTLCLQEFCNLIVAQRMGAVFLPDELADAPAHIVCRGICVFGGRI